VTEKLNSDLAHKNSELEGKNKAHLETLTSNNTKASDLEKQISSLANKVKLLEKSKETLQGIINTFKRENSFFLLSCI
jgi:phage shock protein A